MSDLNKVMLIGRCGEAMDCTPLPSGIACFRCPVGTTSLRAGRPMADTSKQVWVKTTIWHNVTAYGSLAEKCGEHLTPGVMVYVEGSLQPDGNGGTTIEAKDVHFLKAGSRPAKEPA